MRQEKDKKIKIAVVFDDLIQFGGAEKLLLGVLDIWPEAILYTSVCSQEWTEIMSSRGTVVKTSFMQFLPFKTRLNRVYSALMLHVLAFENFSFRNFDVVISVSARYAHMLNIRPETLHICYMNSPARMVWEPFDYFESERILSIPVVGKIISTLLPIPLSLLRVVDYVSSQKVDHFIANSQTPQERIKKFYGRSSHIIYPFVEDEIFNESLAPTTEKYSAPYFLIITRLVSWKKIDHALEACTKLDFSLKIIGTGPDESRLKDLAKGSNKIEFLGYVSKQDKYNLIKNCSAVIVTQKEDFGIVPLEAMALGKPVIAYGKGGVCETILENQTGAFYYEQSSQALMNVLTSFDPGRFSSQDCVDQAKKFKKTIFCKSLEQFVDNVYLESKRII